VCFRGMKRTWSGMDALRGCVFGKLTVRGFESGEFVRDQLLERFSNLPRTSVRHMLVCFAIEEVRGSQAVKVDGWMFVLFKAGFALNLQDAEELAAGQVMSPRLR